MFAATVGPNDPHRNSAPPTADATAPSSGRVTSVTAVSTALSTVVPRNTAMNGGRSAATLTACIAAVPRAGGSAASPRITNVENAQNTPATRPVPSTPSAVSTAYVPSPMSSPP